MPVYQPHSADPFGCHRTSARVHQTPPLRSLFAECAAVKSEAQRPIGEMDRYGGGPCSRSPHVSFEDPAEIGRFEHETRNLPIKYRGMRYYNPRIQTARCSVWWLPHSCTHNGRVGTKCFVFISRTRHNSQDCWSRESGKALHPG